MRHLLSRVTFSLISAAMAVLIAAIFLQVFFRYVLNEPLTWPEELGRYLFVWIVFLGIPDAYRDGKHLGMDLFTTRLPRRVRSVLALLAELLIAAFALVAVYSSIDLLRLTVDQTAPVLQIPMAVVYFAFTLGFLFIILYTLLGWRRTGEISPGQHLYGLRADGEVNTPTSGTS
jgi:TRAP-type C4-dicarboxylate transport system permease small subunit